MGASAGYPFQLSAQPLPLPALNTTGTAHTTPTTTSKLLLGTAHCKLRKPFAFAPLYVILPG